MQQEKTENTSHNCDPDGSRKQCQGGRHARDPGLRTAIRFDHGDGQQPTEQRLGEEHPLGCEHGDRDGRSKDDRSRNPVRKSGSEELGFGGVPRDESRCPRTQQVIEHLPDNGGGFYGQCAEERRQQNRIEGWVVHDRRHAGEMGMDVSVAAPQRRRESCIQAVIVEDSDERLIQGEDADGQRRGRRDETDLYFAGKRQALTLRGTKRLYRRM